MDERLNSFHDLYLTEAIGSDSFVKLFSPVFMEHSMALYQPGNVILKGLQGSGKTMLLNLLRPEIRLAYYNNQTEFPVNKDLRKFISGGINLRKSGVAEFGQLILPGSSIEFVRELTLHFGDFVNYWVVQDLLRTLTLISEVGYKTLASEIGINTDLKVFDKFSKALSRSDCWLGGLNEVNSFKELQSQLNARIISYRQYLNLNIDQLPSSISKSKTAIGEPISIVAELLKSCNVLDDDTNVFIRIDQYEELPSLDFSESDFGRSCQELIHKALSARSSRVSYRIGARHYAWPEYPEIFATTGSLENKRDFSIINIDEALRRAENRKGWIFPALAEDVFIRRLKLTKYKFDHGVSVLLDDVLGVALSSDQKSKMLVASEQSRKSVIKYEKNWPIKWVDFLEKLSVEDPFSAKLAEAWVRQKGKEKQEPLHNIPEEKPYPWDKKYWKKERAEQALVQLASRNKQQLIWQGKNDLIGLSGGNILIFLFLCQHIWDAWLRDTRDEDISCHTLPKINVNAQSMGILNASEEWLKKPVEGKDSKRRLQFINRVGYRYYNILVDDFAMSNPGKNGFSLPLDELEAKANDDVRKFLNLAVDYGDLHESVHTSKTKGEKRKKYYLAPILCPAFKIPYKHIKEPEYMAVKGIREMIKESTQNKSLSSKKKDIEADDLPLQFNLFE